MINEYLILQILVLSLLFFLYWVSDIFNSIIIGIVYLLLISLIALYQDADVLISFLIIIDLGVFFIMFAFILHLTKFLINKNFYDLTYKNIFYINILIGFLLIYVYILNFSNDFNFNKLIENIWFFYITFYNYYDVSNAFLNSDMQLLKEVYFHINNLEFFMVSVIIFFGIIISSIIFYLINRIILKLNLIFLKNINLSNKNNSVYFFKHQDLIKQTTTSASSRVWVKTKKQWF